MDPGLDMLPSSDESAWGGEQRTLDGGTHDDPAALTYRVKGGGRNIPEEPEIIRCRPLL